MLAVCEVALLLLSFGGAVALAAGPAGASKAGCRVPDVVGQSSGEAEKLSTMRAVMSA
jgi:hypothetical protein